MTLTLHGLSGKKMFILNYLCIKLLLYSDIQSTIVHNFISQFLFEVF